MAKNVGQAFPGKAFGIVRDKDGNPRIDDPKTLHPIQIGMLLPTERAALGLHKGAFGMCADGFVRLTKLGTGEFKLDQDARALGGIIDSDAYADTTRGVKAVKVNQVFHKLKVRTDHKAGKVFGKHDFAPDA